MFNGLLDPYRWAPLEQAVDPDWRAGIIKPADLRDGDVLSYVMPPGAVLWNQPLTPHWVDAGITDAGGADEVAASLNISHGGLRLDGDLSPAGRALDRYYRQHPDQRF